MVPEVLVRKSDTENVFLKIVDGKITWTQKDLAQTWPSKYAAKRQLALYRPNEIPVSRRIVSIT